MTIKIVVTPEKYDEIFSVDEIMFWEDLTRRDVYLKMLQCVTDGDGNYLPVKQARELFQVVKPSELNSYIDQFFRAVRDAAVNPTSGDN